MAEKKGNSKARSAIAEPELLIRRTFRAPRELVFAAWTEPDHLKHWQGAPKGMTVTPYESDIRTGGRYRISMRGSDGSEHWLQGVYREVVPPERLVFTHSWLDGEGKSQKETLVTVTFEERDGKTELTLRQTGFSSETSRDGHESGWSSALERLAEYLAGLA
jgi:uncharacterized protein YndB with AHSA1/START domain